jgi:pteridine reductase
MNPTGKVALVTGGGRRVGKAISLALADAGAYVVVNYNHSADEAEETVREIERRGRRALAVQADVSKKQDVDALIETVSREFRRLDILVNSAARFDRSPIADITEEDWDRVLGTNLRGPFFLSQAAAPMLAANGAGVIVNIADLSAFQPWPSYAHHAVSKAGLVHLTRVLARALGPRVRANCVAPGTVLPPEGFEAEQDEADERTVLKRVGSPEDVANAVLYFVKNDFVTGQVLVVDGGRLLL